MEQPQALTPPRVKPVFALDVLKLASAATVAQALSILIAPIVSRLYAPEAFGVSSLYFSIANVAVVVSCMRYELSIMLPEQDEEAANLLGLSLLFVLLVSILTSVVILGGQVLISRWLNEPALEAYLWSLPLHVLASGVFLALNYWNTRARHFDRLSAVRVVRSVVSSLFLLGAGFVGYATAGGRIGAVVIGQVVSTLILVWLILRNEGRLIREQISWTDVIAGASRYRKFPVYNTWAALLNSISWQLPTFMLSTFFSSATVGYYSLGDRVLRTPTNLIGQAIAQVFFQRAAEANTEGTLPKLVETVFRALVVVGLFPSLLLAIVGRDLFMIVFGRDWTEAGVYAQILAVWTFFWFVSSPMSTLNSVLENQEFGLRINIAIFVTRLISLIVGGVIGDVRLALLLFGLSGILVYGYLSLYVMDLAGVSWTTALSILFSNALVFLPVGLTLILLQMLGASSWLILALSLICLGGYVYYIIKHETTLQYLLSR